MAAGEGVGVLPHVDEEWDPSDWKENLEETMEVERAIDEELAALLEEKRLRRGLKFRSGNESGVVGGLIYRTNNHRFDGSKTKLTKGYFHVTGCD